MVNIADSRPIAISGSVAALVALLVLAWLSG